MSTIEAQRDDDFPAVMSPRVLADILEVSVATLTEWRNRKIGPAWHSPAGTRMVRYSRRDVLAWLDASRVETGSSV